MALFLELQTQTQQMARQVTISLLEVLVTIHYLVVLVMTVYMVVWTTML